MATVSLRPSGFMLSAAHYLVPDLWAFPTDRPKPIKYLTAFSSPSVAEPNTCSRKYQTARFKQASPMARLFHTSSASVIDTARCVKYPRRQLNLCSLPFGGCCCKAMTCVLCHGRRRDYIYDGDYVVGVVSALYLVKGSFHAARFICG